jgi:uncharacterized membrane protein YfcA
MLVESKTMDNTTVVVGLVVFLAAFTQSLSGFGLALVAMALLPLVISLQIATPLVALVAVAIEGVLIIRYRQALEVRDIWRVVLAALIGIPLGTLWLSRVNERLALSILGLVIAGYAVYALTGARLPHLVHPVWAYLAGLIGGLLGGAYNTSGPPVIVYADCRGWPRETFKSNLQGYFIVSSTVVLLSHASIGNLTMPVWRLFWSSLPFLAVGLLAGFILDHWLKPEAFRRLVLLLVIIMGLRMVFV